MFDHVGLRVRDLEKAAKLYATMLAPLGFVPGARGDGYAGFGPQGRPALWLHSSRETAGSHLALRAASRTAVDRFYEEGRKAAESDRLSR